MAEAPPRRPRVPPGHARRDRDRVVCLHEQQRARIARPDLSAPPESADAVLGVLVKQATASGAPALARGPVIHARDPEPRAALATNPSLLAQLDSEWFGI